MAESDLMGLLPIVISAVKAALYVSNNIAPFAVVLLVWVALSFAFSGRNRN